MPAEGALSPERRVGIKRLCGGRSVGRTAMWAPNGVADAVLAAACCLLACGRSGRTDDRDRASLARQPLAVASVVPSADYDRMLCVASNGSFAVGDEMPHPITCSSADTRRPSRHGTGAGLRPLFVTAARVAGDFLGLQLDATARGASGLPENADGAA